MILQGKTCHCVIGSETNIVCRLFIRPTIVVRVGRGYDARDFSVHKDLLAHNSPFFKTAVSERWQEGCNNLTELPEDEPKVFKVYLCWLYGVSPFKTMTACTRCTSNGCPQFPELADAYVFGNKILDFDFCDMIVDAIRSHMKSSDCILTDEFFTIWQVSKKNSPPGRLPFDAYAYDGEKSWFEDSKAFNDDFDAEAWRSIAKVLIADRQDGTGLGKEVAP